MNDIPIVDRVVINDLDLSVDTRLSFAELLQDPNTPTDDLHALQDRLLLDKDERALYEGLFSITNSKYYHYSSNISDSEIIWNSHDIHHSNSIFNSSSVSDSSNIFNSSEITASIEANNCTNLNDSRFCFDSSLIASSQFILHSSSITDSLHISNSMLLKNTKFAYLSNQLDNSMFCGRCTNGHHLLFCYDLHDSSYEIFNVKCNPTEFDEYYELACYLIGRDLYARSFITVNPHIFYNSDARYMIDSKPDAIFNGLSKDFVGMIGSKFPNFQEELFFKLFFNGENLKN